MARAFKNPLNGHIETTSASAPVAVLLIGPIYLLFRGLWAHVLVWLAVVIGAGIITQGPGSLFAGLVLSVIYAFMINGIIASSYLRKGWSEVPAPGVAAFADPTAAPGQDPAVPEPSEAAWTIALDEYEAGKKSQGLWAKCFAQAAGDEQKAKASYLEARARELSKGAALL